MECTPRAPLEAAVEHAESLLAAQYLLPDAHYVASVAFGQLGATGRAAFHRYVFDGLLESVGRSGRGTKESPLVVISLAEEYAFIAAGGFER